MTDYDIRDELEKLSIELTETDHPSNLTQWVVESITADVITFTTKHELTVHIKQTKPVGSGLAFIVQRETANGDIYTLAEGDHLSDVYPTAEGYMLGWEEHSNPQINQSP